MKYTITINQYAAVINNLDLDITDLAIFDFIKDFVNSANCVKIHTPEGVFFWISHKLVLEAMPLLNIKTNQGLTKRIDNLIKAGIISKHPNCDMYNRTLYNFGKNYDLLTFTDKINDITLVDTPKQKLGGPLNKSWGDPQTKVGVYNNINNNNNKDNISEQNIFASEQQEEDKSKKTLFSNSDIYKLVDMNNKDYTQFEKKFDTPEFKNVDLVYYFHAVSDWSDQANKKRTARGWIATIRTFIRGDIEKNKLHLKQQTQVDASGAMDYLKNAY